MTGMEAAETPHAHGEPGRVTAAQGVVVRGDDPRTLRAAVEEAFGYRGDVTVTTKDGRAIEGFMFDRREPTAGDSGSLRLLLSDGTRVQLTYGDIATLAFTGRDTAAGKTWENWVRRYAQQKLAGEAAGIDSELVG